MSDVDKLAEWTAEQLDGDNRRSTESYHRNGARVARQHLLPRLESYGPPIFAIRPKLLPQHGSQEHYRLMKRFRNNAEHLDRDEREKLAAYRNWRISLYGAPERDGRKGTVGSIAMATARIVALLTAIWHAVEVGDEELELELKRFTTDSYGIHVDEVIAFGNIRAFDRAAAAWCDAKERAACGGEQMRMTE